jgi:hypothetical protein
MKGSLENISFANEIAVTALVFLAADQERLGRFLALSGIDPQSIREVAREPHFLAGVLEHISGDEKLLITFAAENNILPEDVSRARTILIGPVPG